MLRILCRSRKQLPCLFQLHLSLDSVDSKSQISDNIFNDEDGHYVQCSGELYDLDSNATIGVQKVTSYLYVHAHTYSHANSLSNTLTHRYDPLRLGIKSKTYALLATACALAQITVLIRQMRSSAQMLPLRRYRSLQSVCKVFLMPIYVLVI